MNHSTQTSATIGEMVTLACQLEATAPKPGNVSPGKQFADLNYRDFLQSAVAIGPCFDAVQKNGVGFTVLNAVQAMRKSVNTNTHLGTILLLAPLAAAKATATHVETILDQLTSIDTQHVYEAIRISSAGGLGEVDDADVSKAPPPELSLVEAMRMASDRDLVARQYINGFREVYSCVADSIAAGVEKNWPLLDAIVYAHLQLMAYEPDSLIARKCGNETAAESAERAKQVLLLGSPGNMPNSLAYEQNLVTFDNWLRADGHRRNPGTTADMITAGLFVLLSENRLDWQLAQTSIKI